DAHWRTGTSRCPPRPEIAISDFRKNRVQLDTYDGAKRVLRGKQHRTSHSGANVDKGESLNGSGGIRAQPTLQKRMKNGRSDTEVRRRMTIVFVASFEVATRNQPAGLN